MICYVFLPVFRPDVKDNIFLVHLYRLNMHIIQQYRLRHVWFEWRMPKREAMFVAKGLNNDNNWKQRKKKKKKEEKGRSRKRDPIPHGSWEWRSYLNGYSFDVRARERSQVPNLFINSGLPPLPNLYIFGLLVHFITF